MGLSAPPATYWQKRAEESQALYDASVAKCEKAMQKALQSAQRDVEGELRKTAEKYGLDYASLQKPLTAKELAAARSDFAKLSGEMGEGYSDRTTELSKAIQLTRLQELQGKIGGYIDSMEYTMTDAIVQAVSDVSWKATKQTEKSFEDAYRQDVAWDTASPEQLRTLLLSQRGEDAFSERLWANRNKLISEVQATMIQGLVLGRDINTMAAQLAKAMGSSEAAAMRIVRTETTAMASIAERETYKQAGVTQYEYMSTLDSKTCPTCGPMDGQRFEMSAWTMGVTVPPLHPNCRCTTIPYIPDDEWTEHAERAARDDETGKTIYLSEDGTASPRPAPVSSAPPVSSTPAVPLQPVPESVEKAWDKEIAKLIKSRGGHPKLRGKTPDEAKAILNEALQTLVDQSVPAIRTTEETLYDILRYGAFRSVYEVGGGISDGDQGYMDARSVRETELFGEGQHPVYGYMRYSDSYRAEDRLWMYGDVVVNLKASVKSEVTVYAGDTLNRAPDQWPSTANAVSYTSLQPHWARSLLDGDQITDAYLETQYHRTVTTADISLVQFPGVDEPPRVVTSRLDRLGIPWRYGNHTSRDDAKKLQ